MENNKKLNFDEIFQQEVEIADSNLINGVDARSVMAICRANYDLWMNELFPRWTALKINCHRKIAEIFKSNGYEVSEGVIASYISRLHAENNKKGKRGRRLKGGVSKKNKLAVSSVTTTAENFDFPSEGEKPVVESAGVTPTVGNTKDWLEPSWIGDAPEWIKLRNKEVQPVPGEWSDYWENVWRHLYKKADEEGLNDFDKTTYEGFKKMGSWVADLWLSLNKTRRQLKGQYGWNPCGVGKGV